MAWTIYDRCRWRQFAGSAINFNTASVRLLLLTNAYVPADATDEFVAAVIAAEVSGVNYPAGGLTLTNPTLNLNPTTHRVEFDTDNAVFGQDPGGFTGAVWAVLAVTGPAATSPLIARYGLGAARSNIADPVTFAIVRLFEA